MHQNSASVTKVSYFFAAVAHFSNKIIRHSAPYIVALESRIKSMMRELRSNPSRQPAF
jgi:hypothetical protein